MKPVPFSAEEHTWASKTAMKLRMMQAELGEDEPEHRKGFLDEEVQRALKGIVTEKRPRYILALAEHFPTGFITKPVDATPAENTPEAMVEALVRIAGNLPPADRAEFGLRLQDAGYMAHNSPSMEGELPEELQKTLRLDGAKGINIERLYRVFQVLIDCYFIVEKVSWGTWEQIGKNSFVKHDKRAVADVRKLVGQYLQNEDEVSHEQIKQLVEKTRMVMAGIFTSVPAGVDAFLERFYSEFAPAKIEALAKSDKGFKLMSGDAQAWKKYEQMMSDQMGQIFREKFFSALAQTAEENMRHK